MKFLDDWTKKQIRKRLRPHYFGLDLRTVYRKTGLFTSLARFVLIIEGLHKEGLLQRGFRHDGVVYDSFEHLPGDEEPNDIHVWIRPTDLT